MPTPAQSSNRTPEEIAIEILQFPLLPLTGPQTSMPFEQLAYILPLFEAMVKASVGEEIRGHIKSLETHNTAPVALTKVLKRIAQKDSLTFTDKQILSNAPTILQHMQQVLSEAGGALHEHEAVQNVKSAENFEYLPDPLHTPSPLSPFIKHCNDASNLFTNKLPELFQELTRTLGIQLTPATRSPT